MYNDDVLYITVKKTKRQTYKLSRRRDKIITVKMQVNASTGDVVMRCHYKFRLITTVNLNKGLVLNKALSLVDKIMLPLAIISH